MPDPAHMAAGKSNRRKEHLIPRLRLLGKVSPIPYLTLVLLQVHAKGRCESRSTPSNPHMMRVDRNPLAANDKVVAPILRPTRTNVLAEQTTSGSGGKWHRHPWPPP